MTQFNLILASFLALMLINCTGVLANPVDPELANILSPRSEQQDVSEEYETEGADWFRIWNARIEKIDGHSGCNREDAYLGIGTTGISLELKNFNWEKYVKETERRRCIVTLRIGLNTARKLTLESYRVWTLGNIQAHTRFQARLGGTFDGNELKKETFTYNRKSGLSYAEFQCDLKNKFDVPSQSAKQTYLLSFEFVFLLEPISPTIDYTGKSKFGYPGGTILWFNFK